MGAPIELRFADFEVSLRSGELRRNGVKIKLQEQPFQILVLLLEQRGEVVTRDELRQTLWTADTFVDFDNGLNIAVRKLRTALGDDADAPRYIETLPRRGYRFIAPVTAYEFRAQGSGDTFNAILGEESTARLQAKPEASREPLQITQKETGRERDSDSDHHSSAKPAQLQPVKRETGRGTAITEPDVSGAWVRLGASGAANTSSRSRPIASVWLALALAFTLLISIGAALMYRQAHQRPTLTDKDTIVLGSITNHTGDPALDDSLTQVLRIALEQSPFLHVLSKEKVFRTLEQTHRPTNTPLSRDLALDVCIRTSSKLLVDGNISDLGNRYRLELTAVQCDTGKILSSVTAEPENRERIVHDLGITALQLRSDMGEPIESLRQFDQPIELATSASIEALGAYAEGHAILGAPEAIPLMSRAVQLDSNFALAYDDLATDYYNIKSYELANWNAEKAYDLRSRLAKASRYSVEKNYYRRTGELEKLVAVAEQWRQVYPNSEAHNALSFSYRILGNLEESAAQGREAVRIAPDDPRAYINLAAAYIETDQFGEARKILDEARTKGIESRWLASARYEVAFFLSDSDAMREELLAARGKPGNEAVVLATRAYTEASCGHQRKSRQDWLQAINSAKHYNLPGGAAWQALEALQEAELGNHSRTTLLIAGILNSDKDKDDASTMALALARSGETKKALEVSDELNQRGPRDIILQNYQLPEIRAAVELQRHNPVKAIEMLRAVVPYELGGLDPAYLYPAYLRGLAYLEAGRAPEATLEFRKLIDHRGVTYGWIIGTLAHLQLARAQAMMGDKEAARRSYQDFLTLWKDADPDIPIYKQAKTEYAKLMKPSATTSQALPGTKSLTN